MSELRRCWPVSATSRTRAARTRGAWLVAAAALVGGSVAVATGQGAPTQARPPAVAASSDTPKANRSTQPPATRAASVHATATRRALRESPSRVIFPSSNTPIRSEHARHFAAGVSCVQCHARATTSTKASDRLLPSGATCDRCHATNHQAPQEPMPRGAVRDTHSPLPAANTAAQTAANTAVNTGTGTAPMPCTACHIDFTHTTTRRPRPDPKAQHTPRLRFNHRVHIARNIGCAQCHGAVQRVDQAGRDHLPTMRTCLRCHNLPDSSRGDAKADCDTCHLTDSGGRMVTRFSNGRLFPPRWLGGAQHSPDFVNTHGPVAAKNSTLCGNCHSESSCASCHDSRVRPRKVHPNDFLSMHAVQAKQNANGCTSCHQHETFCKTCHLRSGVSWTGPAHSPSWRGRVHGDSRRFVHGPKNGAHHGVQARRNLMSCVGCHSERDCTTCHAAKNGGGIGINPHPVGFASRCKAALARNPRACAVCHTTQDQVFSRCL